MACRSLLFDTNALLDLVGSPEERPRRDSVAQLVTKCFEDGAEMRMPAQSLRDVYYIVRKMGYERGEALQRVMAALRIFDEVDLCGRHVRKAIVSDEPDFEDGLIRAQAEELGVDAIVTDDRKAFAGCAIPHMSAQRCLETFWPEAG